MKVMFDLNVLLDVVQQREPHYQPSALVLSSILNGEAEGIIPGYAVTTVYYIVARHANRSQADGAVDWLLNRFDIAPSEKADFVNARTLNLPDFEDAVVAALAERTACEYIVTRNGADFSGSPVPAISPLEFLSV